MLLAFLWFAVPVHCQLEVFSGALFSCAEKPECATPGSSDCADDFCGSLESGDYFLKRFSVTAAVPLTVAAPAVPVSEGLPEAFFLAQPEPPRVLHLRHSADFIERRAGSPRAPSRTAWL